MTDDDFRELRAAIADADGHVTVRWEGGDPQGSQVVAEVSVRASVLRELLDEIERLRGIESAAIELWKDRGGDSRYSYTKLSHLLAKHHPDMVQK